MTLTLKGKSSNGKRAIYTGAAIAVTLGVSLFPNKVPPPSFVINDGIFAGPKAPRVARAKMTPEEKQAAKVARANAPKPTLAERVAQAEKRTAALRAKLEKEAVSL